MGVSKFQKNVDFKNVKKYNIFIYIYYNTYIT